MAMHLVLSPNTGGGQLLVPLKCANRLTPWFQGYLIQPCMYLLNEDEVLIEVGVVGDS